jgi:hypothetical protein
MTNAREIIAAWVEEYYPDSHSENFTNDTMSALRAAAGAADGDTITIGPDGTVGRLEDSGQTETFIVNDPPHPKASPTDRDAFCHAEQRPAGLYRVVTP